VDIILGSGSPRRKSILEGIFGTIRVISPSVDESKLDDESAENYVERIARLKMDAVLSGLKSDQSYCVITSDTIVLIEDKILGKPGSADDAFSMLEMLSGKEHLVLTGICIYTKDGDRTVIKYGLEKTSVNFKILGMEIIEKYLGKINYMDKAGSYAIQEHGEMLVRSVNGSITNVIGFPLRLFFRLMTEIETE